MNTKNLQVLADRLNLPSETLEKSLTDDSFELQLPAEKVFTHDEFQVYETNLSKRKYDEAKEVLNGQKLRDLKRTAAEKYNIETDGVKSEIELFDKIASLSSAEVENLKAELNGKQNNIASEYDAKINNLQQIIQDKEAQYFTDIQTRDVKLNDFKKKTLLNAELDLVGFDVPLHIKAKGEEAANKYIAVEKQKAEVLFNAVMDVSFDENNRPISKEKSTGNAIVDRLQNPETFSNVVRSFAVQYNLSIQSPESKKITGTKRAQSDYAGMDKSDFDAQMQEAGVSSSSTEYLKRYGDWKKANI